MFFLPSTITSGLLSFLPSRPYPSENQKHYWDKLLRKQEGSPHSDCKNGHEVFSIVPTIKRVCFFFFFFFSLPNSIDTIKQKGKMCFVRAVGPSSFLYWIYLKWWSWLDLCCSTGTMTQKAFFFFLFMVKISNAIFFQRHIFISEGLHSLPSILLWLTRGHQMHSAQVTNTRVCSRDFFFLPFPL